MMMRNIEQQNHRPLPLPFGRSTSTRIRVSYYSSSIRLSRPTTPHVLNDHHDHDHHHVHTGHSHEHDHHEQDHHQLNADSHDHHEHDHHDHGHDHNHGDADKDDDDEFEMEQEEMFVDAYEGFEFNTIREWGGPRRGGRLPEPTRYGDWERKGRCSDF
jgi:hypothetical protein